MDAARNRLSQNRVHMLTRIICYSSTYNYHSGVKHSLTPDQTTNTVVRMIFIGSWPNDEVASFVFFSSNTKVNILKRHILKIKMNHLDLCFMPTWYSKWQNSHISIAQHVTMHSHHMRRLALLNKLFKDLGHLWLCYIRKKQICGTLVIDCSLS